MSYIMSININNYFHSYTIPKRKNNELENLYRTTQRNEFGQYRYYKLYHFYCFLKSNKNSCSFKLC